MEPQISDFYNGEPHMMRMIENMNDELSESQKEIEILKKKIQLLEDNNGGRPLVEKTIITIEDISKYSQIEYKIHDQLYDIMVNAVDENDELNMRYIFDHENDYIDILKLNLHNVSRDWCEYRIKNILEKYLILIFLDEYYWHNLIHTEELCEEIINKFINSIITGYIEPPSDYLSEPQNIEYNLDDLYIIKCDICNEYSSYCRFIIKSNGEGHCMNCGEEDSSDCDIEDLSDCD